MTEEEYIKEVCTKIKLIRVKKKMTQLELASKIGIEDSSLRRIESGNSINCFECWICLARFNPA